MGFFPVYSRHSDLKEIKPIRATQGAAVMLGIRGLRSRCLVCPRSRHVLLIAVQHRNLLCHSKPHTLCTGPQLSSMLPSAPWSSSTLQPQDPVQAMHVTQVHLSCLGNSPPRLTPVTVERDWDDCLRSPEMWVSALNGVSPPSRTFRGLTSAL